MNNYVQFNGSSLYGNFRTRTFSDIFPSFEEFQEVYDNNGIARTISDSNLETLYYLLYARYGNSNIASSDENQFLYKTMSIIFMYGPTWEKRLDLQQKLRDLPESELLLGSQAIYNSALNPAGSPSTQTLEELSYINSQNTTKHKKSKIDAYAYLYSLLETDVTKPFIDKFKNLFITVVEPDSPLWYSTVEGEE